MLAHRVCERNLWHVNSCVKESSDRTSGFGSVEDREASDERCGTKGAMRG